LADSDINIRKLYTLKIWEDYRRLVQPSGTDGLARMEEQIRRFGCGEPVYVWSRRLLVDFERYATFHRLGIPFRIKNCSARNGEEVIDWICRNQLQRTDLSDAMRRYLIGRQYLSLMLLGKRIRLLHIIHPIIHHTPDGRVPGARHGSHDFNGVLSVEYIVDSIPPADLDRIDLAHIKMFGGLLDMGNRQVALICLVGNQILNWNFLKMYVRNKRTVVGHDYPSFLIVWRTASTSCFSRISSFRAACLAPEDIALKFTDWFARRMELIQAGIVSVRLAISASGS